MGRPKKALKVKEPVRIIALQDSFGFKPSTLKGRQDMRKKVEQYLCQEKLEYVCMNEVNENFCRGFLQFLATAKNGVVKKQEGRIISEGCAHHHQAVLNGAFNKAEMASCLSIP